MQVYLCLTLSSAVSEFGPLPSHHCHACTGASLALLGWQTPLVPDRPLDPSTRNGATLYACGCSSPPLSPPMQVCRRLSRSSADSEFGRRSTVMLAWALVVAGRTALCLREGRHEQGGQQQGGDGLAGSLTALQEQEEHAGRDGASGSLHGAENTGAGVPWLSGSSSTTAGSSRSSSSAAPPAAASADGTPPFDSFPHSSPPLPTSPSNSSLPSTSPSSFRGRALPILRQHLLEHAEGFTSKELCQLYQVREGGHSNFSSLSLI